MSLVNKFVKYAFVFLFLLAFYFLLYKIYIPRIAAFGCFDDCFNIAAGYFINEGKLLYKEIFFNHQMLPAYISAFIQNVFNPINIFELVLRHRQLLLLFSFVFNLFLILRFGKRIIPFVVLFELTKFYVFGDRFLAENFVVYPLIYGLNLVWEKFSKKVIYNFDYMLMGVSTWFIVFMREPFIPLALFIFALVLFKKKDLKIKLISLIIFLTLSAMTILKFPLSDYIFNVFTINRETFGGELNFLRLFESFLYPVYILTSPENNIFKILLSVLSIVFTSLVFILLRKKKVKLILLVLLILGLANIRSVVPGRIFYDAFHMVPWYGLFLSSIFILLFEFKRYLKTFLLIVILAFLFFIPNSFLLEKSDPHRELIVNYGNLIEAGNVIRAISEDSDTLFVDGFDELIYWDTKLLSPYKYTWYTSLMPNYKIYKDARIEMFQTTPPDIYFGSCKQSLSRVLPEYTLSLYQRLHKEGLPTCVYLTKEKIKEVSHEQWEKVKILGYELKEEILTEDNLLDY
jgi:hypothetical protein